MLTSTILLIILMLLNLVMTFYAEFQKPKLSKKLWDFCSQLTLLALVKVLKHLMLVRMQ